MRRSQTPDLRNASQRALTCNRCVTAVSPSFEEIVLPYHSKNGALTSKILSQSRHTLPEEA